jgi:hypothetical protein
MVDFGFRQGLSEFSTPGIARYVKDKKGVRTPPETQKCRLGMHTGWANEYNKFLHPTCLLALTIKGKWILTDHLTLTFTTVAGMVLGNEIRKCSRIYRQQKNNLCGRA